ncbi:MAG TPA: peptidoglycan-binding protein, partial [Solirubrobacterales bacterium]|nr:peptidoglycan-binding protein [Solirubrobacterales bacterium]
MRPVRRIGALALILTALIAPATADASPAQVAAMQSALQALRLYDGYVDGIQGPLTRRAVVALQRRRGLAVDGVFGPRTRRALGWRGRPGLGSRPMRSGARGWDVAALQYLLQRAGNGAGRADGIFGPLTEAAVRRAQEGAGIGVDGIAGAATLRVLRGGGSGGDVGSVPTGPVRFLRPVAGPTGDGF